MSTVITESAGNANFGTGLTVPATGDPGSTWWNVYLAGKQQLADRTQWLKTWLPTSPIIKIPIHVPFFNTSSRFTSYIGYHIQTSVASVGGLQFELPPLPAGRKIQAVTARWGNPSTANIAIGTKPKITLLRSSAMSVGVDPSTIASSTVTSASDTTAVLATYQALHDFGPTGVAHTISDDYIYTLLFEGETGANSVGGGYLTSIYLTLGI